MPNSPLFAPHSPLTVSKYVAASMSASEISTKSRRNTQIGNTCPSPPFLPTCSQCGVDGISQCAACDKQWLACKLWYHSSDGGQARCLKEPYTIPAESNASSRAMTGFLGFPVGSPRGLGIKVGAGQNFQNSQSTWPTTDGPCRDNREPDEWGRTHAQQSHFRHPNSERRRSTFAVTQMKLKSGARAAWRTITGFLEVFSIRTKSWKRPKNLDIPPEERICGAHSTGSRGALEKPFDGSICRTRNYRRGSLGLTTS
jgi:hypothetical protein